MKEGEGARKSGRGSRKKRGVKEVEGSRSRVEVGPRRGTTPLLINAFRRN